jgi:hypothetical protein
MTKNDFLKPSKFIVVQKLKNGEMKTVSKVQKVKSLETMNLKNILQSKKNSEDESEIKL